MVSTTLAAFKSGDTGRVVNLSRNNPLYRQKLLSMGLTPGTQFIVKRIAPLGDPVEIAVRGYSLSLRKHEADVLHVERVTI
jgi:Fe2+ transport system protein FeoA